MVETHAHFDHRLDKLGRKHEKLAKGYVTKLGEDGLIRAVPRAGRARNRNGYSLLLAVLVGSFLFKALMLSSAGPETYAERLSALQNGTLVERVGAFALAVDPVTEGLAATIGPVFR